LDSVALAMQCKKPALLISKCSILGDLAQPGVTPEEEVFCMNKNWKMFA